jgi:hypothetical protein
MIRAAFLAIALLFAATPAWAQSATATENLVLGKRARFEEIRRSCALYLQQYPNGVFKALAEARLAAMERSAPAARPVCTGGRCSDTQAARRDDERDADAAAG